MIELIVTIVVLIALAVSVLLVISIVIKEVEELPTVEVVEVLLEPVSEVEVEEDGCKGFLATQEMVNESLNNAKENGYIEELLTWSDDDIEADLIAYNYEDFGCAKLGELLPLIRHFRGENNEQRTD